MEGYNELGVILPTHPHIHTHAHLPQFPTGIAWLAPCVPPLQSPHDFLPPQTAAAPVCGYVDGGGIKCCKHKCRYLTNQRTKFSIHGGSTTPTRSYQLSLSPLPHSLHMLLPHIHLGIEVSYCLIIGGELVDLNPIATELFHDLVGQGKRWRNAQQEEPANTTSTHVHLETLKLEGSIPTTSALTLALN